jgi:predicted unusual protein kinase regulating ubiquinone biosynthesis (AarF/ABC1/UbiB family)
MHNTRENSKSSNAPSGSPSGPINNRIVRFRFLRAFGVTFRIFISLIFFNLGGAFFGKEWENSRRLAVYRKNARRLKDLLLSLGGIFIKAGQLISILSNFLPDYFRKELEDLQDKIPARPLSEISERIRKELGQDPGLLFAEFDPIPVASASLAQVHRARLRDGRQVAVKVQYLDIEANAKQDLQTIRQLLSFYGFFLRIKGLGFLHTQFDQMMQEELDFRQEAQHIETIAANFAGNSQVLFPKVIHELSAQRVLTTEFMEGVKISDLENLAEHSIDRQILAERVVTAYCQMIFTDGIYHADPHPGNILVQMDGSIVFVDFGAVAKLSAEMKEGILQFFQGILKRDNEQIAAALQQMGVVALHEDTYAVEQLVDYVYGRFLKQMTLESWNLSDLQVSMDDKLGMLVDFSKMDISLRELMATFQIPKDMVLLSRTFLLLLGLCTQLSPTLNPIKIIQPYLETFVLGRDKNWLKLIETTAKDLLLSAVTIPSDLHDFLERANRGGVEVRGLRESANLVYALGHQLLYGLFVMFFGGLGYVAQHNGEMVLSECLFGIGVFFLLSLGYSFLGARKWQKRGR